MTSAVKLLIALAALAFLLGVVVALTGPIAGIPAESLSRASTNLALIAIAVAVSERVTTAG